MKNIVTVIYPGQTQFAYVIETVEPVQPDSLLQQVFAHCNNGSGQEHPRFIEARVRSLSVNDIVCVNGRYFQCSGFGWQPVEPDYVTQLEADVRAHERYAQFGAWHCLEEVMWHRTQLAKAAAKA